MTHRAIGLLALTLAVAACSGGGPAGSTARPSQSTAAPMSTALVSGRANSPTDVEAPGVQLRPGKAGFSVQVGSHNIVIAGNDWDTIVATSKVVPNVDIEFASGFNWTATTRNRFQYLADLIAKDGHATLPSCNPGLWSAASWLCSNELTVA